MKSVTCLCENQIEIDVPEIIDLDANPEKIKLITNGSLFELSCPSCGRIIKPEFPISISWPSHNLEFSVKSEYDRADFYSQETQADNQVEILIGYAELADRLAVIEAGLEPIIIEALKYYLLVKADEAAPNAEVSAWFSGIVDETIEFHLHGLRPDEVAVSRIPLKLYEKTKGEYLASPLSEPFVSLRCGSYMSVQNLFRRVR